MILIAGCNASDDIDANELAEYDVLQTSDEITKGDFLFRLVSEKEVYKQGDEVQIYGEIEYIGDQDDVTIVHSSSAVIFSVEEKIRGYTIPDFVREIGVWTSLSKNKPYHKRYDKSSGYISEQESEDYVIFAEDFLEGDDFPVGYYAMKGIADFAYESERYDIEAEIDFKVIDD